jgi:hypothetical protein
MDALITRDDILREAARWRGTPVQWGQCQRGRAVDCKGLPAGIAIALGIPEGRKWAAQIKTYRHSFRSERMMEGLEDTLIRTDNPQPGDVLAIMMGRGEVLPRHLAIIMRAEPEIPDLRRAGWMMHAYGGGVARVCEVPYARRRIHSFWTWPSLGMADG